MIISPITHHSLVIVLLCYFSLISTDAKIVITEIAYKGSGESTCDKDDWIEFYNNDTEVVVDLNNYILHDDKGKDDEAATILSEISLGPGERMVLCQNKDFKFGIGKDDTITLLDQSDNLVDSVTLPGTGADDETYAYFDGEFKYTTSATPGMANIYVKPLSMEEKYQSQNDAGNDFFLINDREIFSKVVDIHISLDEDSLAIIKDHPAWEEYVSFDSLSVINITDTDTTINPLSVSSNGGKIRTKGQWSKTITTCVGFENVPFQIEFDTPFMGIETMYLRNHQDEYSFMRDHGTHTMLKAFGLPYLRTRPVRLFLNGNYVGFYTLMEAPNQGYVMQRSFGAFDAKKTALFKLKTDFPDCPYDTSLSNATTDVPDPYYFKRGDHRDDIPVLGFNGYSQCIDFFNEERRKERIDEGRGYLEYDKKCGLAVVKMGIVDRDYGSKSIENEMIDFLESKWYNAADDLTDSVDIEQWLRNLAVYAVMLNMDGPMGNINNWYLATTSNNADWKIVQYDHHGIMTKSMVNYGCDYSCGDRMVYWSILRPTCRSVNDHQLVGRILNSEENVKKYLNYVQDYIDVLATDNVLTKLYDYGNSIKKYVIDDPWSQYSTVEAYEESELGTNIEDYNTDETPFLKTLQVRLEEVQKQLDAIQDGTLPLDGEFDEGAVCSDWRKNNSVPSSNGSYRFGSNILRQIIMIAVFSFCWI